MLKRLRTLVLSVAVALAGVIVPVVSVVTQPNSAWAATTCADGQEDCVDTNILDGEKGIEGLLKLIVEILLYGLGAAATVGVVIAGIVYLTARDNPQQVALAKRRLIEISIGLAAWAMLFALLRFLIPGFSGIDV